MVMKLQYDVYNRTFKLVDPEVRTLLEDGEIYDLAIPFMVEGVGSEDDFTLVTITRMAQASSLTREVL